MIGQTQLLNNINELIINNKLPHFLVITGQKGQGKTTIVKYISDKLKGQFIEIEPKVDAIRDMKDIALKISMNVIFDMNNGDKMSQSAANSLLKITEECPENVYICLELQQIENTLPTIKSRCIELQMENYTQEEIDEMINKIVPNSTELQKAILLDCCQNYYHIELLNKYGIEEFYSYVEKVVNNIYKVQSANAFKLTEKLDIKNDGNGYDINLFFETFRNICINNLINLTDNDEDKELFVNYGNSISKTSEYQNKLNITGINKQSLLDMWILSIRKIWRS